MKWYGVDICKFCGVPVTSSGSGGGESGTVINLLSAFMKNRRTFGVSVNDNNFDMIAMKINHKNKVLTSILSDSNNDVFNIGFVKGNKTFKVIHVEEDV